MPRTPHITNVMLRVFGFVPLSGSDGVSGFGPSFGRFGETVVAIVVPATETVAEYWSTAFQLSAKAVTVAVFVVVCFKFVVQL